MEITSQGVDGVEVFDIHGNIDTSTSPDAQQAIDARIADGATKILVDLSKVDFVSSTGLRVFLVTAKRLNGTSGGLRLCGLNEVVAEVFEISGFDTILDVYPSRDEALSGF